MLHEAVEIFTVLPTESGHGRRGGRGEPVPGALWREAAELEQLGHQEEHALRGSKLFLYREAGRVNAFETT